MEQTLGKPNRFAAVLAYVVVLIGPLLILIFGRKNRFSLYHACQALGLLAVALMAPLLWLGFGWIMTWVSVTAPILYLLPIAFAIFFPIVRRRNEAERYSSRWTWTDVGISLVWVLALAFGVWLLLRFLNWEAPPIPEGLVWPLAAVLMVGLSITLFVAWRRERWKWVEITLTVVVALALLYAAWLVLRLLAPMVLPLAGPLLLMSGFSIVIAAAIALVVAWIGGLMNALGGRMAGVPLFGAWGERLFARF